MIHPVILSGGTGTRLWPMSRALYPKQLLALTGDKSLLQETALRVPAEAGFAPPLIIANEEHRFIIAEQLREIGVAAAALVLEPTGRNTAPAACRAALAGAKIDSDFVRLDKEAFAACPGDSIDYAVMEHTAKAAVVPVAMGWSDLGSWDALWEMAARDEGGNALAGNVVAEAT